MAVEIRGGLDYAVVRTGKVSKRSRYGSRIGSGVLFAQDVPMRVIAIVGLSDEVVGAILYGHG
jgi:hypothetical protein